MILHLFIYFLIFKTITSMKKLSLKQLKDKALTTKQEANVKGGKIIDIINLDIIDIDLD